MGRKISPDLADEKWDPSATRDSRVLHDPIEVDDDVVQLGIKHFVYGIEWSRKIDDRVFCTGLERSQQGGTVVPGSTEGLASGNTRFSLAQTGAAHPRFYRTNLDRADSIRK